MRIDSPVSMTWRRKPMISIGWSGNRTPALDRVREPDEACRPIDDPDVDDLGVEDLLDPLADEVVHRLHLDVGGESGLDAVDDRQLGGPLVGLGEQASCLVDEPGVLEGDAQAAGERRQHPDVSVAEGVLAIEVLERDDAGHIAPDDERGEQRRQRRLTLMDVRLAHLGRAAPRSAR